MPDSVREYRFVPLSPVHVGSGDKLAPEDYLVDGDALVRFDPHAVLRALNEEGRRRYEQALDAGRMDEALKFLRGLVSQAPRGKPAGKSPFERYRIALSPESKEEIRRAVEEPSRRKGEIHALIRNPYTGSVIIPGSSIKGAIRTAILSCNVNPRGTPDQWVDGELRRTPAGKKALRLEELGLGYSDLSGDPMRLVEISDGDWPAGAVRVDKPSLEKLGRPVEATQGMQTHLERLLSRADGYDGGQCRIRIQLNEEALRHGKVRELIRKPVKWDELVRSCNSFYRNRLNKEQEHFASLLPESRRWLPDNRDDAILLRVGRHCHFDSLSVDHFREGFKARTRRPIQEIGSTRTLCALAGGGKAPFGWVLLEPAG